MTTDPRALRFLFDYISPYAYLGWTQVHALAAQFQRQVEAVPVLFAGLLRAHGTLGPAEVPAKRAYLFKDVLRRANLLGVPLLPPPSHPFNPLLALRVTCVPMDESSRRRLIYGLYAGAWAGGCGITEPQAVSAIARAAGLDGDALLAAANGAECKERLRRNTEDLVAQGVFGVPTMLVDGELFWGHDAFPALAHFLAGKERLDPELIKRWDALPSSSVRKESRAPS